MAKEMPIVSVVTPLRICGALKMAVQILSGVEVDEANWGCACTRAWRLSVSKCPGRSDCPAVALVSGDK